MNNVSVEKQVVQAHPPRGGISSNRCGGCGTLPYDDDTFCARCGWRLRELCVGCRIEQPHPVTWFCTMCGGERRERGT